MTGDAVRGKDSLDLAPWSLATARGPAQKVTVDDSG
jgi:hypothetical protein